MKDRVRAVKAAELIWPFDRQRAELRLDRRFGTHLEEVDPFPAYAHDIAVVRASVAAVEAAYPLPEPFAPDYFVLPFDTPHYTNGWSDQSHDYRKRDEPRVWAGVIVLAGKRIPPHPAMTRYLVPHEYGHIVHMWLAHVEEATDAGDAIYAQYAKLRGFRSAKNYGGGTWHRRVSEVFANDFRILVAKAEVEFWPHPGIPRPEDVPEIGRWWADEAARHKRWMVDRGLKATA